MDDQYIIVNEDGVFYYKDKEMTILHREGGPAVERVNGDQEWWLHNKLHREDGPAVQLADGTRMWFINDEFSRKDISTTERGNSDKKWWLEMFKPKMNVQYIQKTGSMIFYYKDKKMTTLHRERGPAVEDTHSLHTQWRLNGKLHREDGPALIDVGGNKFWYFNDQRHRKDGPAVECINGDKEWWLYGQRHREDGPAIQCTKGEDEYWIKGQKIKSFPRPERHYLKYL